MKVDEVNVRAKWEALMAEGVDPEEILTGLAHAIKYWEENLDSEKFIPNPWKWLNNRRWKDRYSTNLKFKKKAPSVEKATNKAVAKPTTATPTPQPASFSEDEKAFLDVYGKKPHTQEDINLFHAAFECAMKELDQDIKLLCAAATIAIDVQTKEEGDTRRMKRASYWLDDCEYRQYLKRARDSVSYLAAKRGIDPKSYWDITIVD
ncbi:MAG: hypothetical protein Q4F99_05025 [bacterium]|nr:hypothetical protein [bacterium]